MIAGVVLLVSLLACADGRVITPARTQDLFHTPYRSHDSRHFKVSPPSFPCFCCLLQLTDIALCLRYRLRPLRPSRPMRRGVLICRTLMVQS